MAFFSFLRLRRQPLLPRSSRGRLLGACLAAVAVWSAAARGADLDEIRERKLIRVALPAQDTPPFVITRANGEVSGLEGELVQDLARRMGVQVEFVRTARGGDELIALLKDGRADLALGELADSLERAKSVRFTVPYLTLYQTRLFNRLAAAQAGGVAALLERPDAHFAVRADSVAWSFLREEMDAARLVARPDLAAALAEAEAGRAAAVIGDDVEMSRWFAAHPEAAIRWETELQRDRPLTVAMAMHWRAENLQAWLNLYLGKCSRDQTLSRLWAEYLGEAHLRAAE
jgi:ABC-type amino acid transport substrate-binding protein